MSRIAATFQRLGQTQRKALIPFFTVGDPTLAQAVPLMQAMVRAGADLLELGIPFSDPMADGPTIQRASERALQQGVTLRQVLSAVTQFRALDSTTPVVLMGYANPIERLGLEHFADECAHSGVDGVLVVDYPPREAHRLGTLLQARGIDSIYLLSPTSTPERVAEIGAMATGYIYYVSLRGVTGAAHIDQEDVARQVQRVRACTRVPVGVGFGIRDGATAQALAQVADGIVIGSRLVEEMEASPPALLLQRVETLIADFRHSMDQ